MKSKKFQTSYIYMFLASILVIALAFLFRERLSQFRSLGLAGIFLINFFGSATVFLPTPAIASVVAGGIIYPPFAVAAVSAVGSAFGEMVGFFLGHSSHRLLIKTHHRLLVIFRENFQRYGDLLIFFIAFVPNPFFDAIGIFAGAFSYSPTRFFLLLFAGRLLRNVLLAYAGRAF